MPTLHAKLTKNFLDTLRPLAEGELFVLDTELPGFGYRLKPSGAANYFIKYVIFDGPRRRDARTKIAGKNAAPDEARRVAKRKLAGVALGADPSAEKKAERAALTVEQLCSEYLDAARGGRVMTRFGKPKCASTIAIDEGRVARHIVPLIGNMTAAKVAQTDIQRMADDIAAGKTAGEHKTKSRGLARVTGGSGTAARVVELWGGIWSWSERRGLVAGQNPARGIEKHRGDAKSRTLSRDEYKALEKERRSRRNRTPMACDALRLIALTALRREEACGLRWSEFDADGSCLRLAATKTGRSTRPIGKAAVAHLRSLPRLNSDFVFPNGTGDKAADLKKQIADIFNAAGLPDARSHDLRRSYASVAADLGYSDATIAELLGHARRGVTARHYIRRPDAALVAAADGVAARIAAMLDGRLAKVIKIEGAR